MDIKKILQGSIHFPSLFGNLIQASKDWRALEGWWGGSRITNKDKVEAWWQVGKTKEISGRTRSSLPPIWSTSSTNPLLCPFVLSSHFIFELTPPVINLLSNETDCFCNFYLLRIQGLEIITFTWFFHQGAVLGCELLAQVFAHLDIVETDYFGLQVTSNQKHILTLTFVLRHFFNINDYQLLVQYTDEKSVSRWIDPEKSIKKQTCKQRGEKTTSSNFQNLVNRYRSHTLDFINAQSSH